jgi:PTS system N-acetylglucosamine-specific IIC component
MTGMFPMMIFGLPAACLAMYRNALPGQRKLIGGILLSMALTSALTGVTEPIEFAFMFLAPLLYVLHALLTGLAMALASLLDIHLGFTFSGGAIDMALGWGKSTNGWRVLPLGAAYAVVYYLVFDQCIKRFNLKTPGREQVASSTAHVAQSDRAGAYITALGGAQNLLGIGACTTRLRLQLVDRTLAKDAELKALGAMAVVRPGSGGSLQIVVGPLADSIADELREALPDSTAAQPAAQSEALAQQTVDIGQAAQWFKALGGGKAVVNVECVALTRLRVQLKEGQSLAAGQLEALGCQGVRSLGRGVWHVLVGDGAQGLSEALRKQLKAG